MTATLAVIGGTGLDRLDTLTIDRRESVETPYGRPAAALTFGRINNADVIFLPRHGDDHALPPHKINYRANIQALKQAGVRDVIAVAAVGGIGAAMHPGRLAVPSQIIDYTYGREHTLFADDLTEAIHVDFSHPYSAVLRERLLGAAQTLALDVVDGGVYGATQGPRLETAAEIERLRRDGCDLVGMTGMPEAALAREAGLNYACCAVIVNWAAGVGPDEEITMDEIRRQLVGGMAQVRQLLTAALMTS